MRKFAILIFFIAPLAINAQKPEELIKSTLDAMGGLETWRNMKFIQSSQVSHKFWLEQSENPNGPFITSYDQTSEIRGVHERKLWVKKITNQFVSGGFSESQLRINGNNGLMQFGQRAFPMPNQIRVIQDEHLRYSPDNLLLTALEQDLILESEESIDGVSHYKVSFVKDKLKHSLFINKRTHLISQAQIESFLPYDIFNYPWGKFITTIKYSIYWLYPGGIRYPAQWDVSKLDKPYLSTTFLDLQFQAKVDTTLFEIPDSIANVPKPPPTLVNNLSLPTDRQIEIAKGIHSVPGMWNVGMVVQEDGIVVIEAPISSGYNKKHLELIKSMYPLKKIKAVVVTSDAWPHVGGVREFIAQGIPVYTHFLNEEIINRVANSDHSLMPDSLEKAPKRPIMNLLSEPIQMNDPINPIRLIPINGEGGERMTAIYFPKQNLLYASDLVQYSSRRTKKFFAPQYLSEIKAVVDKYDLSVDTVFAMHMSPIPWTDVLNALESFTHSSN